MDCPSSCGTNATRWLVLRVEGPPGKHAISYRCRTCGNQRLQLASVQDLQGFVQSVVTRYRKQHGVAFVDNEEFVSYLYTEAWALWLRWTPSRGVPFSGYLARYLPLRANQFYRSSLGRTGNKPTLVPIGSALDARRYSVGETEPEGTRDPTVHSSPDLLRLLAI